MESTLAERAGGVLLSADVRRRYAELGCFLPVATGLEDQRLSTPRGHGVFLGVLIGQRQFVTNRSQYKHERKRVGLPQVIHSLALRACMPENLALCN